MSDERRANSERGDWRIADNGTGYRFLWQRFADEPGSPGGWQDIGEAFPPESTADLAHVAAAAAGLRVAGPGETVVREDRLRETLRAGYYLGMTTKAPLDAIGPADFADQDRWVAETLARLTAAPRSEESA